ncbi:MAG TPA: TIGR03067 domain-containing protein [Gemmataceae bacterium]|nr:TIGR03067 domain-containing protein [Gemmataceae bacterium]
MNACFLSAAVLGLALAAADAPDDATKKDLEKMQGAWTMQSARHGGNDLPADKIAGMRLVFDGSKYKLTKDGDVVDEGTFTLMAGKKIDIRSTKYETNKFNGIYQFDGDTFKEAVAPTSADRPTELESKQGSDVMLIVLQREKK